MMILKEYLIKNNKAYWKDTHKRYCWYGNKQKPNYSICYWTRINLEDFLNLTSSERIEDLINNKKFKTLDIENFNNSNEDLSLILEVRGNEGKVVGCDGRHRAYALMQEGIKSIDILIYVSNNYDKENPIPLNRLMLKAQYKEFTCLLTNIKTFAYKNIVYLYKEEHSLYD